MRVCNSLMALAVAVPLALSLAAPPATAAPTEETLTMKETEDAFVLTVPVSRLVMEIPREGLAIADEPGARAGRNPRYFHLANRKQGLVISGWIEPVKDYMGIDDLWKQQTDAWKQSHAPDPQNSSIIKLKTWDAVLYDLDMPHGKSTHIRAEWAQLGTWIDLHIAVTTYDSIELARKNAMDLLKSIEIKDAHPAGLPNGWPVP